MGSELLAVAAVPPTKPPSIPSTSTTTTTVANGATTTITTITTTTSSTASADVTTTTTTTTIITTTTTTTITSNATTIASLSEDDLREIFLRLPNLPALIRAALTCRSWLGAIRSSSSFRRLFRALHPAPLIGLFLEVDDATTPSFVPLCRSDPDVTAALRRGDFFLTSLPLKAGAFSGWGITDCRDGYVLLWNMLDKPFVAAMNPMTWAVDIIPLPDNVKAGRRRNFAYLGFHLLCSDENPWSFRVVCVCSDQRRVRVAIFSSETWDWVVHPWVHTGGDCSLKFGAGMVVDGSVYWPYHGQSRMIKINVATGVISTVELPFQVEVEGFNFMAGETKDGRLCIVYESDFFLHVWIRGVDGSGIEIWEPHNLVSLSEEIDQITRGFALDLQGDLKVVQVRSGYVYLSTTCTTPVGTLHCWFFSLSLDTLVLELLVEGKFDGCAHPYSMAWPPSLVGEDGSIGHEVEASH